MINQHVIVLLCLGASAWGQAPEADRIRGEVHLNQPLLPDVDRRDAARPPSGGVSVAELLHPPSRKALQAVQAASKLSKRGDHQQAAVELQKATELSPDFAAAWINLAAQHLFLKRYELALQELDRASRIAKPTALVLGNIAYGEFALQNYQEGEQAARESLRLDGSYAPAHYLLGAFLALDPRTLAEGIRHLEIAAASMPFAIEVLKRSQAQLGTHD